MKPSTNQSIRCGHTYIFIFRLSCKHWQRTQAEYSRKTSVWLRRQQSLGLDQIHVEGFELGRKEVDEQCLAIVAKAFQVRSVHITGEHSNHTHMWLVNIGEYIGLSIDRGF